jgi:hypothetical protein
MGGSGRVKKHFYVFGENKKSSIFAPPSGGSSGNSPAPKNSKSLIAGRQL